jgi:PhnB protein
MQVMVFGKATKDTEAEVPPTPAAMEAMGKYTEALMAAGIIKDNIFGGLKPSRFAKRVQFSGKNPTVIDGPFADTKELVAGFMLWEVQSIEEAIEWVKKNPLPADSEVEIRPLYSMEDFAAWDEGR